MHGVWRKCDIYYESLRKKRTRQIFDNFRLNWLKSLIFSFVCRSYPMVKSMRLVLFHPVQSVERGRHKTSFMFVFSPGYLYYEYMREIRRGPITGGIYLFVCKYRYTINYSNVAIRIWFNKEYCTIVYGTYTACADAGFWFLSQRFFRQKHWPIRFAEAPWSW